VYGIQHTDLDDETRIIKRNLGKNTPIRVLKQPKNDFFIFDSQNEPLELLRFRFNEVVSTTANKPIKPTVYLTFKQKRYNQRNIIGKKNITFLDDNRKISKYSGNPFLKDLSIIEENFSNPTKQYRMVKKAKTRIDNTRVGNWNRLLRSRRVLVLPAHINITVITNSFDIVHSWHIPGLGLKMDCLPGRATHHTLYIDNVGLYYGQCAEICGRYHHHMPIRICALPFEHFLVWWHTFGLPKFLFPSNKESVKNTTTKFFNRKFSW
jgi:heme/copper-type cytochrome/quinol oxidase subunit 2